MDCVICKRYFPNAKLLVRHLYWAHADIFTQRVRGLGASIFCLCGKEFILMGKENKIVFAGWQKHFEERGGMEACTLHGIFLGSNQDG